MLQRFCPVLQAGLGPALLSDVTIDRDKATIGEGSSANLKDFAIGALALEDVRPNGPRLLAGLGRLYFRVSRFVLAAFCVIPGNGTERGQSIGK